MSHGSMLACLEDINLPPSNIIIRGNQENIREWQHSCQNAYKPQRMTFAVLNTESNLPDAINDKFASDKETLAYICEGVSCYAPISNLKDLKQRLN